MLHVFYSFHNKKKISDIDSILHWYRKNLWTMFQDMIQVYGADPRQVFLEYRASLAGQKRTSFDLSTQLPPLFTYRPAPVLKTKKIKKIKKKKKKI